ncbi:histidinol-phosphate transaminase [Pseudalkalibacillus berkeleyi]|uniref:Histidinol-phosphate aminotransferase n=1 Tax=Pseudalkalibacillus berkeleyi TaxID=1069813 RepID=A0ABS9H1A3_9BACL|nr:histidinol-phosphate transaminase [Pseudalkalibacillus berkeleyi]MCF6137572.1 histidinol-phosphate transaminase [Pseudalkalibacillus berkeleyi]
MKAKEQIKSLKAYKPGKPIEEVKKELGLETITKLASNENPFGCADAVKDAVMDELERVSIYPDGYAAEIRTKLSEYLGVKPGQILFGNGSDEVIEMFCRTYLSPESNTIMATPTFPQYKHNSIIEGAEIIEVPLLDNGKHDLDQMYQAIDDHTKIIWLCSPNNPTGTYITEKELVSFLKKVPSDIIVACDEAYREYVVAEDYPDTVELQKEYTNLIIFRTFSKAFGLASLRIGYGVAHEDLMGVVDPVREPFNTSRVAQRAAITALEHLEFIETCRVKNREGMASYESFCKQFNLDYFPSQGNFILIDFKTIQGDEIFDYLLRKGFIVRSGNALGYLTSVRITVGSQDQNDSIINCLSEWLVQKGVTKNVATSINE